MIPVVWPRPLRIGCIGRIDFMFYVYFVAICLPVLSACVVRVLWLVDTGGCSAPIGRDFPPVVAGVTVRLLRGADVRAGAPSSLSLLPESNKGWGNSDGALIFRTEQRLPPTAHCRAGSIFLYGWLENKRWLRLTDGCCDVIEPEPCVTTGHCWFIRRGIF